MFEYLKSKATIIIITIFITILAIQSLYIKTLSSQVENLNSKLSKTESLLALEKANNINLSASIQAQNNKIELIKNDYDSKNKEFEQWKQKPAEIKYKEIIKKIEVKSNECKDIKIIIDDIRNTSF